MRIQPLTRLRLYFVALGAVLLAPLGFLLNAVDERVQAQRRLRHEVVADRIFDELERELTLVLESEALRPSSAYEEATRIEAWAPFVIGYFKLDTRLATLDPELIARDQLEPDRVQRLLDVLGQFREGSGNRAGQTQLPAPAIAPAPTGKLEDARPVQLDTAYPAQSTPEVLQKLNRSQEERKRKSVRVPRTSKSAGDPMYGF